MGQRPVSLVEAGRFCVSGHWQRFEHVLHTAGMSTIGPAVHDSTHSSWDSHRDQWQDIANELPIPRRSLQHDCWIPVTARLVWERDGLELRDTVAYAWFGRLVLVEVLDHRRYTHGVWLHVSDVRRR